MEMYSISLAQGVSPVPPLIFVRFGFEYRLLGIVEWDWIREGNGMWMDWMGNGIVGCRVVSHRVCDQIRSLYIRTRHRALIKSLATSYKRVLGIPLCSPQTHSSLRSSCLNLHLPLAPLVVSRPARFTRRVTSLPAPTPRFAQSGR